MRFWSEHQQWLERIERDTVEKSREYPPPEGWGWSLVYRDGVRRPDEDLLVQLSGYDPASVFIEFDGSTGNMRITEEET